MPNNSVKPNHSNQLNPFNHLANSFINSATNIRSGSIMPSLGKIALILTTVAPLYTKASAEQDDDSNPTNPTNSQLPHSLQTCLANKIFGKNNHLINPNMRWTKHCDKTLGSYHFYDDANDNKLVFCELKTCYPNMWHNGHNEVKDPRAIIDNWSLYALKVHRKDSCGKHVVNEIDDEKIRGLSLHPIVNPYTLKVNAQGLAKNCKNYFNFLQKQEAKAMTSNCENSAAACPIYEKDEFILKAEQELKNKKNKNKKFTDTDIGSNMKLWLKSTAILFIVHKLYEYGKKHGRNEVFRFTEVVADEPLLEQELEQEPQ